MVQRGSERRFRRSRPSKHGPVEIVADARALRYPFGSFQNDVEAKLMIQDL